MKSTSKALGTHAGYVHILDLAGTRRKTYKPHTASVSDICFDTTGDFVCTAGFDGKLPTLPIHL